MNIRPRKGLLYLAATRAPRYGRSSEREFLDNIYIFAVISIVKCCFR